MLMALTLRTFGFTDVDVDEDVLVALTLRTFGFTDVDVCFFPPSSRSRAPRTDAWGH